MSGRSITTHCENCLSPPFVIFMKRTMFTLIGIGLLGQVAFLSIREQSKDSGTTEDYSDTRGRTLDR
jgi:hypothetical protein